MGHSLLIVTFERPSENLISDFCSEHYPEMKVSGSWESSSQQVSISDAKHVRSIFVDSPLMMEAEDVADSVLTHMLAPQWQTEIQFNDGSKLDGRLAHRLAKAIATEGQGVVFCPEQHKVTWPKSRPSFYRAPASKADIDLLRLRWTFPYEPKNRNFADSLIRLIAKHIPEALPKRFGTFEPFQGRISKNEFGDFLNAWVESAEKPNGDIFHFTSTSPFYGGHVIFSDPRDSKRQSEQGEKCLTLVIDFDSRAFANEAWVISIEQLFADLADTLGAIFAIAYLEEGWTSNRNRLATYAGAPRAPIPRSTRWLGLPVVPGWLFWIGPAYKDLVTTSFSQSSIVKQLFGESVLFKQSNEPIDKQRQSLNAPKFPEALCAIVYSIHDGLADEPASVIPKFN